MSLLSKGDKDRIEKAIATAEKNTSGEIVVRVVRSSGGYAWVPWCLANTGMLSATALHWLFPQWGTSALSLAEWQLAGFAVGLGLTFSPQVRRFLVPRKTRAFKVHREALARFVAEGIVETQDRTGVLIYISEFENCAEILADKGIHSRVPSGYWDDELAKLVDGIKRKDSATALCAVIQNIGAKLAEEFPPRPQDSNELSDKITE